MMLMEVFEQVCNTAAWFVISSMITMGVGLTIRRIIGALQMRGWSC